MEKLAIDGGTPVFGDRKIKDFYPSWPIPYPETKEKLMEVYASLLFSATFTASSDRHFAFLHFLFLGMVLITASCTVLQTSIHSSSGTQSIRSNPFLI